MKELAVAYSDEKGEEIKLTGQDVVEYISTDNSVTEKEVFAFLNMCKYLKLNPFLKEIYLIKYKGMPATFVISYQTLLKRAEGNKNFDGYETEIQGEIPNLTATATVYRKDRKYPVKITLKYGEAVKTVIDRQTGELRPTAMWKNMPEWMLRKVALARALKEAFPEAVGNAQVSEFEAVDPETSSGQAIEGNGKGVQDKSNQEEDEEKTVEKEPEQADGEPREASQKEGIQKALDVLYGVSEKEAKERKLKLYEILKEKKIDTLAKVKELLKEVIPDEDWSNIKKDVFEKMPVDKLTTVLQYLSGKNG